MKSKMLAVWLVMLIITALFQGIAALEPNSSSEIPVFLTMVDVLPDQTLDATDQKELTTKLTEAGIDINKVYEGVGRIGSTISIDDLAMGIAFLEDHETLRLAPKQIAKLKQGLELMATHRSELVACQERISAEELACDQLRDCLLAVLSESDLDLLLTSGNTR